MNIKLDVNADAFVDYANKLEKLPKAVFPNVVRSTLNTLAFDVKTRTMPRSVKRFTNRQKNFFKITSRVDMARGNHVDGMKSTVGFVPFGGKNTAVEDLEAQEHGGVIPGRSFVPMDKARTSKSPARIVSRKNRISGIKNIVKVDEAQGRTTKQKFIKSVVHAGKGGHVLHENTLFRVDRLQRTGSGWKFRLAAIYSFDKGRKAKIKRATHFMEKAVDKTAKRADEVFLKKAEKQFEKYLT